MKLIIGPLTNNQIDIISDDLLSKDYRLVSSTKLPSTECNAIRINKDDNNPYKCKFTIGNYDKYIKYIKDKNNEYLTDTVYDFNYYEINMMSKSSKVVNNTVVSIESNDIININKQNVLNTYKLSSTELQIFMRNLFGEDLFKETTYKIGDWFKYLNNKYVLTKINKDVVTLIDTKTYENYSLSKSVRDMYKITENELRSLIGINYDKFKLIK